MKKYAKLLVLPVAFLAMAGVKAADYTVNGPITFTNGTTAIDLGTNPKYIDLTADAPTKGTITGMTAVPGEGKSYVKCTLEETIKPAAAVVAAPATYCAWTELASDSGVEACAMSNEAKVAAYTDQATYEALPEASRRVKTPAVAAKDAVNGLYTCKIVDIVLTAGHTLDITGSVEVSNKVTAGVNTLVTIKGTLKGDMETAGGYKVVGGAYNTSDYKVTYVNPVGVPTGLAVESVKDGKVNLEWNEVYGADVYVVRRSEKAATCGTTYTTLSSSVSKTSYTDATAKPGKTYCYSVAAKRTGKTASEFSGNVEQGLGIDAPSKLTIDVSYNKVKLTAAKVANVTGYVFFRSDDRENWKVVGVSTSTAVTDDTVEAGKTYYYTVAAYVKDGDKYNYSKALNDKSFATGVTNGLTTLIAKDALATTTAALDVEDVKKAEPKLAVAKISKIADTSTLGNVKVTLTKVDGAKGYVVYMNGAKVCDTTSTTCTVEGLTIGNTNVFVAIAYRDTVPSYTLTNALANPAKDKNEANTTVVFKDSSEFEYAVKPTAPKMATKAVKLLKANGTDPDTEAAVEGDYYNTVKVTVTEYTVSHGEELTYVLYQATSKKGTFKKVAEQVGNVFYPTDLKPGKTYYFKAKVRVNSQLSDYSPVRDITVKMTPYGKNESGAPAKLTALNNDGAAAPATVYFNRAINLTLNKVEGATGYVVYRATSKSGKYTAIKTILTSNLEAGDTFEYKNTKLTAGKKYYYKVRAYKTVDSKKIFGDYSSIVSATAKLTAPEDFEVEEENKTSIKLSWSKVSGATGYRVYTTDGDLLGTTTKTSITIKGLDKDTAYSVYVKAYSTVNGKKKMGIQSIVQNPHTTAE